MGSKSHTRALPLAVCFLLLGAAVTAGCGSPSSDPRADRNVVPEPGAATDVHVGERPGTGTANDLDPITAQRWIDDVRMGDRLDADGVVVDRSDDFSTNDALHLSLRVTDAPVGTAVRVGVYDATSNEVWNDEQTVSNSASRLTFDIGDDLAPGEYEARVFVGDEKVADRDFEIAGS